MFNTLTTNKAAHDESIKTSLDTLNAFYDTVQTKLNFDEICKKMASDISNAIVNKQLYVDSYIGKIYIGDILDKIKAAHIKGNISIELGKYNVTLVTIIKNMFPKILEMNNLARQLDPYSQNSQHMPLKRTFLLPNGKPMKYFRDAKVTIHTLTSCQRIFNTLNENDIYDFCKKNASVVIQNKNSIYNNIIIEVSSSAVRDTYFDDSVVFCFDLNIKNLYTIEKIIQSNKLKIKECKTFLSSIFSKCDISNFDIEIKDKLVKLEKNLSGDENLYIEEYSDYDKQVSMLHEKLKKIWHVVEKFDISNIDLTYKNMEKLYNTTNYGLYAIDSEFQDAFKVCKEKYTLLQTDKKTDIDLFIYVYIKAKDWLEYCTKIFAIRTDIVNLISEIDEIFMTCAIKKSNKVNILGQCKADLSMITSRDITKFEDVKLKVNKVRTGIYGSTGKKSFLSFFSKFMKTEPSSRDNISVRSLPPSYDDVSVRSLPPSYAKI